MLAIQQDDLFNCAIACTNFVPIVFEYPELFPVSGANFDHQQSGVGGGTWQRAQVWEAFSTAQQETPLLKHG